MGNLKHQKNSWKIPFTFLEADRFPLSPEETESKHKQTSVNSKSPAFHPKSSHLMFCPLYLGSRGFHPAASFRTQLCAYTRCKTPPLEVSTIKDLRIAEMEKQRVQSWSCRGLEKQTFNNRTGSRRKSLRALKGTCPRPPPVLWECQAREHVIQ